MQPSPFTFPTSTPWGRAVRVVVRESMLCRESVWMGDMRPAWVWGVGELRHEGICGSTQNVKMTFCDANMFDFPTLSTLYPEKIHS